MVPVTGQDADLAIDGAGAHERGLARPDLLVDRDELDIELLVSHPRSALLLDLGGLALDVLDATAEEERLLRQVVVLPLGELLERLDRLADRHERPVEAGEGLGDEGVLRQEALDAAGPPDEDLVLFGELVDAEDGDDVLQVLVALQ